MGHDHVIPEFINQIKKIKKNDIFKIEGTGNEIRSFIHIDDFISGFDRVFKKVKIWKFITLELVKKLKFSSSKKNK